MNWDHIRSVLWLRWRLMVNQINRQTWVTRLFSWGVFGIGTAFASMNFFGAVGATQWLLPDQPPSWLFYVWLGVLGFYTFSHLGSLISELQQQEVLSIEKFLHLPMSTRGVYLLNYFASSINLTVCTFIPLALGLVFGMGWKWGPHYWLVSLLIVAFFAMTTASVHLFRGWLAALMADQRRKRTVIAIGSGLLVMLLVTPNLLTRWTDRESRNSRRQAIAKQRLEWEQEVAAGRMTTREFEDRLAAAAAQRQRDREAQLKRWDDQARSVARFVPVAWPAVAVSEFAQGRWGWFIGSFVGMLGLAALSLSRGYHVTLGHIRKFAPPLSGESWKRAGLSQETDAAEITTGPLPSDFSGKSSDHWLTREFWGLSDPQAAVAWATLRGLSRMPEAKLAMLIPLIFLAIAVGTSLAGDGRIAQIPLEYRGLSGIVICFLVMMGITQLIQNQFGLDRQAFRGLMLAPVLDRDILIGKNAALAPLAVGLGLMVLLVLQVFVPMKWSHLVATAFQLGNAYLTVALVANLMSIMAPCAVKPGSMKPVNLTFTTGLLQLLIFLLAPLGMIPALLPLGLELALNAFAPDWGNWPIYLIGSILWLGVMSVVYTLAIQSLGGLLAKRRQKILGVVTQGGN